ncbi:MAG: glycosyltransferase family 39 protein [Pseudomonadota bacterium]
MAAPVPSIDREMPRRIDEADPLWARYTLAIIALALVARFLLLAQGYAPLHFDEAQYWSYGEDLAAGYYSKPPLVAWLIRVSTEIFGDTGFGVRFFAPLLHGWIAWLLFATGRHMFDDRTGFWAALTYLCLPGVTVSSGLMTTDPAMMAGWGAALYALTRALIAEEEEQSGLLWWLVTGAAIGAGLLGKYTMIGFVGGCLGYALFSREGSFGARRWPVSGPLVAVLAALAVLSPNLWWNAQNDFATIAHVGDNTQLGQGVKFNFGKAAEFFGAQAAIFGPLLFVALIALVTRGRWRDEWGYRLLLWLSLPLPILMTLQAFLSRAHPNWAAPAYIAASLAVAAWLLDRGRRSILIVSAVIGGLVFGAYGVLGHVYAERHTTLPRLYDPYKKMRPGPAACRIALDALGEDERLLSDDRRLLADCLFEGGLPTSRISIWNPDERPGNHYELVASLREGDPGPFVLLLIAGSAEQLRLERHFETVEMVAEGRVRTHADRETAYRVMRLDGFKGYP